MNDEKSKQNIKVCRLQVERTAKNKRYNHAGMQHTKRNKNKRACGVYRLYNT